MPRIKKPTSPDVVPIGLAMSAQGTLRLDTSELLDDGECLPRTLATRVERAFRDGPAAGLLHSLAFGRELAKLYLTALRMRGDAGGEERIVPEDQSLGRVLRLLPPLVGAEYATEETLLEAWCAMDELVQTELAATGASIHDYLQQLNPAWHALGRVTFHLAEQKDVQTPFAFLATYAEGLGRSGRVRHLPLGKALSVYREDRDQLLRLLRPVSAAAERSPLVKSLVESGELYEPLAWSSEEAYAFLLAIPECEAAGIAVRVPDWWKGRRPARVQASAQVGAHEPAGVGLEALLSFDATLCLDGGRTWAAPDPWQVG